MPCLVFTSYLELYWSRFLRIAFLSRCERGVSSKRPACDQAIIYLSNGAQDYFFPPGTEGDKQDMRKAIA